MEGIRELAKIADDVVIKIPLGGRGGASYVSPFVGRVDDRAGDGMGLVSQILQIYENYGFETEVIVASVRHVRHVVEAALLGAHIATVPCAVAVKLFDHPLTDEGIKRFLADWKKSPARAAAPACRRK